MRVCANAPIERANRQSIRINLFDLIFVNLSRWFEMDKIQASVDQPLTFSSEAHHRLERSV